MAQLDENKLNAFIGKMLGDLGGAFSVPTVRRAVAHGHNRPKAVPIAQETSCSVFHVDTATSSLGPFKLD